MFSDISWRSWLVNPRHTSNSEILQSWYHCQNTKVCSCYLLFLNVSIIKQPITKAFWHFWIPSVPWIFSVALSSSKTTFKYLFYRTSEHTGLTFWTLISCFWSVWWQWNSILQEARDLEQDWALHWKLNHTSSTQEKKIQSLILHTDDSHLHFLFTS